MNYFDTSIIAFLNGFANLSQPFDYLVFFVADNALLKGGVLVTLLWWLWFRTDKNNQRTRERILLTLVASVLAIVVARTLAFALPFRARPLDSPQLGFHFPSMMTMNSLPPWSSFPSDHAVLFFALATGFLLISRKLGAAVLVYVLVVICFPRMYLGIHYPTDIIAGAILGTAITLLVTIKSISQPLIRFANFWSNQHAASFYASLFFLMYQIGEMFESVRDIGGLVIRLLRGTLP